MNNIVLWISESPVRYVGNAWDITRGSVKDFMGGKRKNGDGEGKIDAEKGGQM